MPDRWPSDWDEQKAGKDCVICAQLGGGDNDYWVHVHDGHVTETHLERRSRLPGYCIVVWKDGHVAEPTELPAHRAHQYWAEVAAVGRAIETRFSPVKINYLTLGNTVPHLHTHVVPRYADDPAPGGPLTWDQIVQPDPRDHAELHTHAAELRDLMGRARFERDAMLREYRRVAERLGPPIYGLGRTWTGTRRIRGHGGGGERSHLVLGHERGSTSLDVETHRTHENAEPGVRRLMQWAMHRFSPPVVFPLRVEVRQWDATIRVDGTNVTFDVVGDDDSFSAGAIIGDRWVTVFGAGVGPTEIDLVTVDVANDYGFPD